MTTNSIQITHSDHEKLTRLIEELKPARGPLPAHLQFLQDELQRAQLTASADIGGDVVTLYSRLRVTETDSVDTLEYTLVPPDEADIAIGKISVLSPLGAALLGYRAGDAFTWPGPDGSTGHGRVEKVLFQPEENGRRQQTN